MEQVGDADMELLGSLKMPLSSTDPSFLPSTTFSLLLLSSAVFGHVWNNRLVEKTSTLAMTYDAVANKRQYFRLLVCGITNFTFKRYLFDVCFLWYVMVPLETTTAKNEDVGNFGELLLFAYVSTSIIYVLGVGYFTSCAAFVNSRDWGGSFSDPLVENVKLYFTLSARAVSRHYFFDFFFLVIDISIDPVAQRR